MDKDYRRFYERLTTSWRNNAQAVSILNQANRLLTMFMYVLYPCLLFYSLFSLSWQETLGYLLISGVSFLILSAIRAKLNWKRPYEDWEISPLIPKNTKGKSMPSRHVFSATIIATTALSINIIVGLVCIVIAILIGILRVLGGVHYPRDVIVGFMIGLIVGSLYFIL